MKRFTVLALAAVILLFFAACEETEGSKDAISIGKNAVSVADRYLDGNISANAARDKLDDLLERMDYLEDMSSDDEWYYQDHLIRTYIFSLDTYIFLDDYGKIESVRNDLAAKVGEEPQAPTVKDYTTDRTALQEYITIRISQDALGCLTDSTDITVLVSDSGTSISARVVLPQNIPFVAEELCSILATATADLNIAISDLTVNSYSKINAGDISSMVNWHTNDLQTGILLHEDEEYVSGGYTVDKLYEYFGMEPGEFIR